MNRVSRFCLLCVLVLIATTAVAQPQRRPFKLTMTALDAKTQQPRSTFVLGEPVVVRVSLTNLSRTARTIIQLKNDLLPLRLSSMLEYENGPDIHEGYFGGSGMTVSTYGDMTVWSERKPRTMTIRPGQTVSETIDDLSRYFFQTPFQEGSYTLTAKYNASGRSSISFRIVVDEKRSIPLLEELAAAPVKDGRNDVQRWAKISLDLVRLPSISGRIVDSDGRPLKDVFIEITGTEKTNVETRHDGRYRLQMLSKGGTYTLTPKIWGEMPYTLEPTSKTISDLNGKVTDVNFIATRIRVVPSPTHRKK